MTSQPQPGRDAIAVVDDFVAHACHDEVLRSSLEGMDEGRATALAITVEVDGRTSVLELGRPDAASPCTISTSFAVLDGVLSGSYGPGQIAEAYDLGVLRITGAPDALMALIAIADRAGVLWRQASGAGDPADAYVPATWTVPSSDAYEFIGVTLPRRRQLARDLSRPAGPPSVSAPDRSL